jgi:hypothetical protein
LEFNRCCEKNGTLLYASFDEVETVVGIEVGIDVCEKLEKFIDAFALLVTK